MRKSVLKTIAAVLNSEGGSLLIGVEDNMRVCGLANDLQLTDKSTDKFMNLLVTLISDSIGVEFANLIKISIETAEDVEVV